MAKRGAAEGRRIDWVAALAPRSPRSADSFSVSSPAHPMRKRGGGARVDIDWCSMFGTGTPELPEAEPSPPPAADVVPRSAGVGNDEQVRERMPAGGSRKKARKGAKKPKKSEDAMVRAMEMCVQMRKKQVEDQAALLAKESAESRNFSISRCIHVLHKMEGIRRDERPRAYNVFRNAENREIFLASAAVDEETTVLWLRSEMAELPRGT